MGAAESRIAAAAWSLLAAGATLGAPPDALEVRELAPGVFVHIGRDLPLDAPGHDDIANVGFVVGTTCVAVIDTGGSVRLGERLRGAIVRRTRRPICYVINTHVHVDHVLGNVAFKSDGQESQRPAVFVGHAALAAAIERNRDFFVKEYPGDLRDPASVDQVIAPDRIVEGTLELDLGGRVLSLRAWPEAHTDCDLTVLDERTHTLWTGDLLFRERLPALDGSLKGWLRVLDELERIPAQVVVPGHGAATSELRAAVAAERGYLSALADGVRAEVARGADLNDAIGKVAVSEQSHWRLWDSVHPRNVVRAYRELEWE